MKKKLRIASRKNRKQLRLIYRLEKDSLGGMLFKIYAMDMIKRAKMIYEIQSSAKELTEMIKNANDTSKPDIQQGYTAKEKREVALYLSKVLTDGYEELMNYSNNLPKISESKMKRIININ